MPLPPKDPKQAFEEIAARREAELAAQKAKREADIEAAQQTSKSQQQAYGVEVQEAKERREGREEWRQGEHQKRREDEEVRRKKEIAHLAEEEEKKKLAEAQRKRDEALTDLHSKAVKKRADTKVERARMEEGKRKHDVTIYEERSLSDLDADAERRIEHFKRESSMRKKTLQTEGDRKKVEAEEQYKMAKKEAESQSSAALRSAKTEEEKRDIRMAEAQAVTRAQAERKRILFNLDETLAQKLFDIDTETKRLIDEVTREFTTKKQMINRDANRKRTDAAAQLERVEEWFGRATEEPHP